MIPTAQTLAAILNDPAIPREAKGEYGMDAKWENLPFGLADPMGPHLFNAALFWSMSAWLWGRGICPWIDESIHTGYFAAEYRGDDDGPYAWPTKPTPLEALAAVVRAVANPVD